MKKAMYELRVLGGGLLHGPTTITVPEGIPPMLTCRVAPPSKDKNGFKDGQELQKAAGALAIANPGTAVLCEWCEDGTVSAWLERDILNRRTE